ncbi:hypothetical protein GCM10011409_45380 [Lentibacillus populi]|uniref:Uncharacterized protein n=1 Tax=Lentibacillus populi TaxID=1827502 RepID=A0A9W5U1W5_9BACI|nr:hypothetical protein [Lentibacillus populi]GGB63214.1 hypothetical protein GCM10011409_45380 [Lentibacillus populi]
MDFKVFKSLPNEGKKQLLDLEWNKANLEFLFINEQDNKERSLIWIQIKKLEQQRETIINQYV